MLQNGKKFKLLNKERGIKMSKRRMNNKGMTLVEIVIVLLIASIAMTITGGILINSLGYFQDTTELSTDKTAGDGLLDLLNLKFNILLMYEYKKKILMKLLQVIGIAFM